MGEDHPGKMIEETPELDEGTKQKLLADNAMEFLGVRKEKFL